MSVRERMDQRAQTRSMEQAVLAEMLEELRRGTASMALLRSLIDNDVLTTRVVLFDSTGVWTESFATRFGSLWVANHGVAGHDVTVLSGPPPTGTAPTSGVGVHVVRGATSAVVNMADGQYTLIGTAADRCSVQVFTKPQPPASGPA